MCHNGGRTSLQPQHILHSGDFQSISPQIWVDASSTGCTVEIDACAARQELLGTSRTQACFGVSLASCCQRFAFFPQLLLRRKLGGSCCIRSGVSGSRAGSLEAWSHSGRASSMSLLCSYASSCSPLVCLQKCDLPELERKGGLI